MTCRTSFSWGASPLLPEYPDLCVHSHVVGWVSPTHRPRMRRDLRSLPPQNYNSIPYRGRVVARGSGVWQAETSPRNSRYAFHTGLAWLQHTCVLGSSLAHSAEQKKEEEGCVKNQARGNDLNCQPGNLWPRNLSLAGHRPNRWRQGEAGLNRGDALTLALHPQLRHRVAVPDAVHRGRPGVHPGTPGPPLTANQDPPPWAGSVRRSARATPGPRDPSDLALGTSSAPWTSTASPTGPSSSNSTLGPGWQSPRLAKEGPFPSATFHRHPAAAEVDKNKNCQKYRQQTRPALLAFQ